MYARVSTSPDRASCITHGTSPRSSKRTFAASLAVCTTIGRLYESPARAPERVSPGRRTRLALLDPEPVEQALVPAPVLANPDLEVEEDAAAELALELGAGRRADLLDLAAARADQDPLLGLGLRPDVGVDLDDPVLAVGDLGDLDLDRVGQLVAGATQDLLADQLGEQDLARQVGPLLGREQERALRDELDQAWRSAARDRVPSGR